MAKFNKKTVKTLVLSDGIIGMEAQCMGLVAALGLTAQIVKVTPHQNIVDSPELALEDTQPLFQENPETILTEPHPDIILTAGRKMAGVSAGVKKRYVKNAITIHFQEPHLPQDLFSYLIIPDHDTTRGENVILTRGSIGKMTEARLRKAGQDLHERVASLPRPIFSVSVGGSNIYFKVDNRTYEGLAGQLQTLAEETGGSIIGTTSKRTGEEGSRIIKDKLGDTPGFIWTGEKDAQNPYPGLLEICDAAIVTSDSVNMISEACFTGKPVYVLDIGENPERLKRFITRMSEDGFIHPFGDILKKSNPPKKLDEAKRVAEIITKKLFES